MKLDFDQLNYRFLAKPLLIGGKAMEYYGLRKAGADVDFVVTTEDYANLAAMYPNQIKEIFGDFGVCVGEFELWQSIVLFGYNFLAHSAVEAENFKVISLERLLFLKALGIAEAKYEQDVRRIVQKINDIQYGKDPHYHADYFNHDR